MGSVGAVVQYGSSGRVFTATNCSAVRASSVANASQELTCRSAPGVGRNLTWSVTVGQQTSDLFYLPGGPAGQSASQYVPPSVVSVTPAVSPLSTRGRQAVTLVGAQFGPAGMDVEAGLTVTYGPVGELGRRYTARGCAVDPARAHTAITCITSSGVGSNHVWRVTTGDQESLPSLQTTSYAPPVVASVRGQGTYQAKTDGGQLVAIAGSEFGSAADALGRVVVTYGPVPFTSRYTAGNCSVNADFTSISCLTSEGTGAGHSWVVLIDGTPSTVFHANTSYGPPVVASYSGVGTVGGSFDCFSVEDCGSTRGHQVVNISGQNFGPAAGSAPVVHYGPSGIELSAANCSVTVSHSQITCYTVPAAGAGLKWTVVVGATAR
jgi:hypothetical protein